MLALLREARESPADSTVSVPTLEALSRSFTADDARNLYFHSDRIYRHSVFKNRYATYDCRSDCDILNPSTSRRDFMCVQDDTSSPPDPDSQPPRPRYVYGRLLGIFHANVMYAGPGISEIRKRRFDFLWVRWFTAGADGAVPWQEKKQDVLSFPLVGLPGSCGFLDPANVVRAAHIIPRFASGPVHDIDEEPVGREGGKKRFIFSRCAGDRTDWKAYYVNR